MLETAWESFSIIIPTLNGAQRLPRLLRSIRAQSYDQTKIEIIVVDDASTDDSANVSRSFGAKVIENGFRNIERGKAIGLKAAKNDLVFFIDDDNSLPTNEWLQRLVRSYLECPEAVGAQASRFLYRTDDPPANRYCSLFGINDPMAYYLRRRDRLAYGEKRWCLAGEVAKECEDYWLVRFTESALPTVGSQGYLTRRSLLEKTDCWPYLFHIDSNFDLVRAGHELFLMMKDEIVHDHCKTTTQFVSKLRRNMRLFLEQSHLRRFKWDTPTGQLFATTAYMVTVVGPLLEAMRVFAATRDTACFLHPYFCVRIPIMYIFQMLSYRLASALRLEARSS